MRLFSMLYIALEILLSCAVTLNGEPPSTDLDVLTDNSTEGNVVLHCYCVPMKNCFTLLGTMTSSTEAVPPNTQTTDSSTSELIPAVQ